jgi:hypothetical protein
MSNISNTVTLVTLAQAPRDSVVTFVWWAKSITEVGYEQYYGEQDAEVTRRRIKKMEQIFVEIEVLVEVRVKCVV